MSQGRGRGQSEHHGRLIRDSNHVNLNIGSGLTVFQAVAYSIDWLVVGVTISAIYRG